MPRSERSKIKALTSLSVPGTKRCAIYTRKSTEEGLEQNFNSLAAQREACEAYVLSQRHEGWTLNPTYYDDGGYSGGSMARPGLQALLADINAGHVDVVVVYKVDRLSRALTDFAKMVDCFDNNAVSFVSVTQAFNTTTSMGRLTLNVLLSFAQFEREVGAERVRDKVAASRKKGIWMGGTVPQGYKVENRKLIINPPEAERIRLIFELYLTCGSTTALLSELNRRGMRTAQRISQGGRISGHVPFGTGAISYLLSNRTYIGDVVHKGEIYPGEHDPILDRSLFETVQQKLASQAPPKRGRRLSTPSLLTGLIFDSNGNRMSPTHANKRGIRYRYYTSRALAEGRKSESGNPSRVSAPEIESAVLNILRESLSGLDQHGLNRTEDVKDDQMLVATHLRRIVVHPDRLVLEVNGSHQLAHSAVTTDLATTTELVTTTNLAMPHDAIQVQTLTVRWSPKQTHPRQVIIEAEGSEAGHSDVRDNRQRLAHAIHNGRSWFGELASGSSDSIDAIAMREGKHVRTIRSTIALAFLAPDMVEHLIAHGLPEHWTITDIARRLPRLWSDQRKMVTI